MKFSERHGFTKPKEIQLSSIDEHLRTGLWNIYYKHFYENLKDHNDFWINSIEWLPKSIWTDILKRKIDEFPSKSIKYKFEIRYHFEKLSWELLFDFIEANLELLTGDHIFTKKLYVTETNQILEKEFSAYRIISDIITPISSELEINEINNTIDLKNNSSTHILSALEKLSDRNNPDYRNSIKESISAVEYICREVTGESSLGEALKKLDKAGVPLNNQFKEGLVKLYAFTNSKETGIRHTLLETPDKLNFDDAKFFLVICSAFVNYLISIKK